MASLGQRIICIPKASQLRHQYRSTNDARCDQASEDDRIIIRSNEEHTREDEVSRTKCAIEDKKVSQAKTKIGVSAAHNTRAFLCSKVLRRSKFKCANSPIFFIVRLNDDIELDVGGVLCAILVAPRRIYSCSEIAQTTCGNRLPIVPSSWRVHETSIRHANGACRKIPRYGARDNRRRAPA